MNNSKCVFAKACFIEPRLLDLLEVARNYPITARYSVLSAWLGSDHRGGLKRRMMDLVGFEAADARLRSVAYYDACYEVILSALPDWDVL